MVSISCDTIIAYNAEYTCIVVSLVTTSDSDCFNYIHILPLHMRRHVQLHVYPVCDCEYAHAYKACACKEHLRRSELMHVYNLQCTNGLHIY